MKECLGTKPLCEGGKNAICNTETGVWYCPSVIAPEEPPQEGDAKETKTSDNGDD